MRWMVSPPRGGAVAAFFCAVLALSASPAFPQVFSCNGLVNLDYPDAPACVPIGDVLTVKITIGTGAIQGGTELTIDRLRFDMFGNTAFFYCLIVLFLCWLAARYIVHSPFGRSLTGIRENVLRMHAVGAPVASRKLTAYTISAALAGISGALIAQTAQFVGLGVLGLERSGTVLIMLIIGGVGQLYGAFIGVTLYMIAQDRFSAIDPVYWYFWIGLFMVLLVVFARGGVLGTIERLRRRR